MKYKYANSNTGIGDLTFGPLMGEGFELSQPWVTSAPSEGLSAFNPPALDPTTVRLSSEKDRHRFGVYDRTATHVNPGLLHRYKRTACVRVNFLFTGTN